MEYFIQYDEELGVNFEIPELDLLGCTYDEFVNEHRGEILECILGALMTAVENDFYRVPVFALRGHDTVFTLEQSEYLVQLEKCIDFFSEEEEYELCAIAKELVQKIKP